MRSFIAHVCWSRDQLKIEHAYSGYGLPKRYSIHRRRVKSVIRPPLYPQATTAGSSVSLFGEQYCLGKFPVPSTVLIQLITENRLRHARGPVHLNIKSVRYIPFVYHGPRLLSVIMPTILVRTGILYK